MHKLYWSSFNFFDSCCPDPFSTEAWVGFEFIGVLRHTQQNFSHMWRHRCADGLKKKLNLSSGSQRHRHFAGFFNVPVLHRHGTILFIWWCQGGGATQIQIETSTKMYTQFLIGLKLTIWTICAFRVLNPRQRSLAKQCNLKSWKVMTKRCQNKLEPKGMV